MSAAVALLGIVLGAAGAAIHLAVTWWRASLVASRRATALALVSYPLALVGPAAAVLLAAKVAPEAAWLTPVGFLLVRFVGLRALAPRAAAPTAAPGADGEGRP